MKTRLTIVEDNPLNRETIKNKLQSYNDIEIVGELSNGKDFLNWMQNKQAPDVVLMDIEMPVLNGIDAIKQASPLYPSVKFIILTVFEETEKIFEAIKNGACGYLLKDDKAITIYDAIQQAVLYNGIPMSPVIAQKAMALMIGKEKINPSGNADSSIHLSDRETEVLVELAKGSTYQVIGNKLHISPLTVRKHVSNLYSKLHVNSRVQIVEIAKNQKLI